MRCTSPTMSGVVSVSEKRVKILNAQLSEIKLELKKQTVESSRTEAELQAEMCVVEKSLRAKKTRAERPERGLATDV